MQWRNSQTSYGLIHTFSGEFSYDENEGRTSFALADVGITRNLGPALRNLNLRLGVEGIRK